MPGGFFRKGYTTHGGFRRVQHIMASSKHFTFSHQRTYSMSYTDHPAFLVHLKTK